MVRELQSQSTSGVTSSAARSATDLSSPSKIVSDSSIDLIGHLSRQGGDRMRYVEPSFWAVSAQKLNSVCSDAETSQSMCEEVSELDELLGNQARYLLQPSADGTGKLSFEEDEGFTVRGGDVRPSSQNLTTHLALVGNIVAQPPAWSYNERITSRTVARNPDFLRQLPSKRRCDALVEGYINGYHPMVPVIHVPSFHYRYEEFWRTRTDPDASTTASMSFAALLVTVLYAGSVACPSAVFSGATGAPAPEEAATQLHILALRALRLSNFPRTPTLDSFRAYLICQSTWMREEEPLTCVAFVGLALRVATMLGLHKDPSRFGSMNPIECEVRRRVWWQLVHIDVLVAIASGLPPMVDLKAWDVKDISELKEEHFGTQVGMEYTQAIKSGLQEPDAAADPRDPRNASMVSTVGILVAGKLRATLVLRRTLAMLFTGAPLTTSDLVVMRSEYRLLGEDLRSRIARIPEPQPGDLGRSAMGSTFENNFALNRWARLLLSAFVDEQYCISFHPVIKARVSEVWPDLYPQAIQHCRAFLNKCAQMASVPDFGDFQWSWPGNHQPLHAITILLLHLVQGPDGEDARETRRAIDIAFALCGSNGGIVAGGSGPENITKRPLTEGGQEAWSYFKRLRSKAWQKAGLDPDVFWTREQAVRFCNGHSEPQLVAQEHRPIWNEGYPGELQDANDLAGHTLATTVGSQGDMEVIMSPPNIDWTYLDAVLGSAQNDAVLDYGPCEDESGEDRWVP
ncbi:hypothetical protein LTR78_001633 [Recurvomyces mirabilis]|uniref:Xylanolytic transcriptional activator regulatory domain-containing protein n=1 Tax=Recurvomyces mirabilis TaxID=574656 RepID=A0AAE1C540_9PEZI|nr:hypothetical protein LTR78_001633 [Recurvomyces mirabilis]KAK5151797.1 hypothetical protein LTS14_008929 [Recurvomyces mirabilis]